MSEQQAGDPGRQEGSLWEWRSGLLLSWPFSGEKTGQLSNTPGRTTLRAKAEQGEEAAIKITETRPHARLMMGATVRALGLWLACMALLVAGCASPSPTTQSGTVEARTDGGTPHFVPDSLNVAKGDSVTFRDVSGTHTVTFDDADGVSKADSGPLNPGDTFQAAFSKAGSFHFHCQFHMPNMEGTIHVQ